MQSIQREPSRGDTNKGNKFLIERDSKIVTYGEND
jgi:hypothetical protein